MKWLSPPKTEYASIDDVGRFNMIWQATMALVPIFILLSGMHVIFHDKSIVTSLAALCVSLFVLFLLWKTRKFVIPGAFVVFAGISLVQIVIWVIDDSHVVSDTMWCLLIGFFTYFLFGSITGTIVLMINLGGLVAYLLGASGEDLVNKGMAFDTVDYKMAVNVLYVGLALAYIIHKMVSNTKQVNLRYQAEIEQNEVLLKEIHHRVKNNLQIIASLLRLQASDTTNEQVKDHFNEAISRIRSMSLIHEKMYQNENMANVDVGSYLQTLAQDISGLFCAKCHMDVEVESEIQKMNINVLVSVALIFNELVTNSIKHGFMDRGDGEIRLVIKKKGDMVEMIYWDNGGWKEPVEGISFGLDLIKTLTEQMDGSYILETDPAFTRYVFTIPGKFFA